MAKETSVNKRIKNIALRFGEVLKEQNIPIERIVIFGSYAKDKADKDSDIDICIVSSKFGKDHIEELQFLLKQTCRIDTRIEPIPVSPKEYRETASPLIFEIKKYGQEIYRK